MSLAAVAAVLVSLLALPATSALAKPAPKKALPGTACTVYYPNLIPQLDKFIRMCFHVEATGNHVEHMEGWDYNHTGYDLPDSNPFHIEIVGPAGHIANCDNFPSSTPVRGIIEPWYNLGNSPECRVEYHADVPAGRYCQKTWRLEPASGLPGSKLIWVSLATPACVDVHN